MTEFPAFFPLQAGGSCPNLLDQLLVWRETRRTQDFFSTSILHAKKHEKLQRKFDGSKRVIFKGLPKKGKMLRTANAMISPSTTNDVSIVSSSICIGGGLKRSHQSSQKKKSVLWHLYYLLNFSTTFFEFLELGLYVSYMVLESVVHISYSLK